MDNQVRLEGIYAPGDIVTVRQIDVTLPRGAKYKIVALAQYFQQIATDEAFGAGQKDFFHANEPIFAQWLR